MRAGGCRSPLPARSTRTRLCPPRLPVTPTRSPAAHRLAQELVGASAQPTTVTRRDRATATRRRRRPRCRVGQSRRAPAAPRTSSSAACSSNSGGTPSARYASPVWRTHRREIGQRARHRPPADLGGVDHRIAEVEVRARRPSRRPWSRRLARVLCTTVASSPVPGPRAPTRRPRRVAARALAPPSSAAIDSIRERSAMPVDDPRAVQVVGGERTAHAVTRQDANPKAAHLAGHVPSTTWSLSSFTRNIALGSASITSPSNSTLSSLATLHPIRARSATCPRPSPSMSLLKLPARGVRGAPEASAPRPRRRPVGLFAAAGARRGPGPLRGVAARGRPVWAARQRRARGRVSVHGVRCAGAAIR